MLKMVANKRKAKQLLNLCSLMSQESSSSPPMEMSNQFKREIVLAEFSQWSAGEQCLFLSECFNVISLSLVKFMSTICHDLSDKNSNRLDSNFQLSSIMEDQANDIAYFHVLNQKSIDTKLKFLTLYLPLLKIIPHNRSLNDMLKDAYNELIQNVLEECLMETKYLEQCNTILVYAKIHPIFDNIQKLSFQKWKELFQEVSDLKETPAITNGISSAKEKAIKETNDTPYNNHLKEPAKPSKNIFPNRQHMLLGRAASSPIESSIKNANNNNNNIHMLDDITNNLKNQNSFISNTNLNFKNENNGMKNLAQWLKIIKLHKYTDLFATMTYNDLMNLTDEKLIASNITLGARKKMLSCIEKLKERPVRIQQLIQILDDKNCVIKDSTLENILIELTEISMSPIEPNKSDPTSITDSECYSISENTSNTESPSICQLILVLFDKIQNYLLKSQPDVNNSISVNKTTELIKISLKIIDKLFLSKAFCDVQNLKLAKMRTKFNEKVLSLNALDSSNSSVPSYFAKRPHALLTKSNSSYGYISNNTAQLSFRPNTNMWNRLEVATLNSSHSVNARQRIQNKTLTTPFYGNSNSKQQLNNEAENSVQTNSFLKLGDEAIDL